MADMDITLQEVEAYDRAHATPAAAASHAPAPAAHGPDTLDRLATATGQIDPVVGALGTAQSIVDAAHVPALEQAGGAGRGLLQGAGGGLSALGAIDGVVQTANGVHSGNGNDVVQGGLNTMAGVTGVAGTIMGGAAATTVAPIAAIAAGSYGLGRTLDEGVGQIMGEAGSTRTVANRGAAGGTHEVRDDAPISERLERASHTSTGDHVAMAIAPYLPRFLGGDGWFN